MADKKQQQRLFEDERQADASGPVECLGMTFESDEARREYFLQLLAEKLADPNLRNTPGFPEGSDEAILRLSDPPYFTACPNPFLVELCDNHRQSSLGTDDTPTEPLAADVSEGKHDPVYKAHTYHTKVPPKAISRFLEHYTDPGDLILDPFCGSGMTGVAGILSGNRTVLLSELSPAAAHIAAGYTRPWATHLFERAAQGVLDKAWEMHASLFSVFQGGRRVGEVRYWVWTDVLVCEACANDYRFSDAAVDLEKREILSKYACPHCSSNQSKSSANYARSTHFDPLLGRTVTQNRREPFWIVYQASSGRVKRALTAHEVKMGLEIPSDFALDHFPTLRFMKREGAWGCLHRSGYHYGMTHAHHFYSWRTLLALDTIWGLIEREPEPLRHLLRFWFMATAVKCSKLMNYNSDGIGRVMKGSLYVSSLTQEASPFHFLRITLRDMVSSLSALKATKRRVFTSVNAAQHLPIPSDCVDYVFVDPPFGKNLIYSELNFLWECWLGVFTDESVETIVNQQFGKTLSTYTDGMSRGFAEVRRVLKPGRWMTVEFHNSQNAVWNALQQSLERAGFVVADVRVLDKKHGSIKQVQTTGAVKKDLIISVYKPPVELERRFELQAGTEAAVWDFVRAHLRQLPVFVTSDGQTEVVAERQCYMLFDRMVAFHVQRR
ncbi:DNA methyltransferase [Planctomycetota bacterium]